MHNSRKGFTLAEVLITLTIIGVVAALTIPTLISSTTNSQYQTTFKKALGTLNQALTSARANNGTLASGITDAASVIGVLDEYLNIVATNNDIIWLADGTKVLFLTGTAITGTAPADKCPAITGGTAFAIATLAGANCYAFVDVNGDKEPNTVSTPAQAADVYVVGISPNAIIPIEVTDTLGTAVAALDFDAAGDAITGDAQYVTGIPSTASIEGVTK